MAALKLCVLALLVAVHGHAQQVEPQDYTNTEYTLNQEPTNPPPYVLLNLELPKQEAPSVPFYHLDEEEGPDRASPYPAPSDELQVPAVGVWNPANDPTLFYPLPDTTRPESQIPTNLYPKRYLEGKNKTPKKVGAYVWAGNARKQVRDDQVAASSSSSSNKGRGFVPSTNNARSEFQMHGYAGPRSYKWGHDTGKGQNRQFRYEQRDNDGYVKGHYGYYDHAGQLRMVHYDADPESGFHAHTNP